MEGNLLEGIDSSDIPYGDDRYIQFIGEAQRLHDSAAEARTDEDAGVASFLENLASLYRDRSGDDPAPIIISVRAELKQDRKSVV